MGVAATQEFPPDQESILILIKILTQVTLSEHEVCQIYLMLDSPHIYS